MLKKLWLAGMAIGFIAAAGAGLALTKEPEVITAGATTFRNKVEFDYIKYETKNGVRTKTAEIKNSSGGRFALYNGGLVNYDLTLNKTGTNSGILYTLQQDEAISYNTVTLKLNVMYPDVQLRLYDGDGKLYRQTSSDELELTLPDDTYRLEFEIQSYTYQTDEGSIYYTHEGEYRFQIDTTAPVIEGASPEADGLIVGRGHTVTATDATSGVEFFQWRNGKTGGSIKNITSPFTIPEDTAEGYYRFSATDYAGNDTGYYYLYYDPVLPEGHIRLKDGTELENGANVNEAFVFDATDNIGVKEVKVKRPGSADYITYTDTMSLTTDGEYSFYCVDTAGNRSETYTVVLDTTPPKLTCSGGSFSGTTDKTFTVSASDVGGAVLFYKTSEMTSFVRAEDDTYTVNDTSDNGVYWFYAEDGLGNRSERVWVELKVENPVLEIVRGENNSVYITWDGEYTVTVNGQVYTEGTLLTEEGSYTVRAESPTGRESVYTFEIGHAYVAGEVVAPTCTEEGYTVYICQSCGDSYQADKTAAVGHDYISEEVEASCTEGGGMVYTCTRCGDSYAENATPPLGHSYVVTTQAATCTEYGKTIYTCRVCGEVQEESNGVYPTGHNYSNFIIKAATCTEDGERRYVCDKCGDEYTEVIAAPGHSYAITDSTSENGKTTRIYTCTACGDSYTQKLGDQYDEVSTYVEDLFEQYRPYMVWVFLATVAVWSIVMGVFFIIAHKNEDKEKARKMLVNYFIGLVIIFSILVACPYLVRGIAVLVS